MDKTTAVLILEALADGTDPFTGEKLQDANALNNQDERSISLFRQ